MGFFDGLSRSFALMKLSLSVVKSEKKLLIFPVLTGIATIAIMATFILPLVFFYQFMPVYVVVLMLFVLYFLLYFVGIYFTAALIGCATMYMQGGKPELSDGFTIANRNMGRLLQWALVAAIVGLIIRALESAARDNIVARIIISLIGFAWSMATFFVVPVILYEELNVGPAIKRSGNVFRNTWGETWVSSFGFGIFFLLLGLLGFVPLIFAFIIGSYILIIVCLVTALVWWVLVAILATAVDGVLTAALYRYARTGEVGLGFAGHEHLFR
jgi:hypothetical protein